MKKFFTISEFAKLRNLDINSLRYYEKLGLLTPSAVNRETGYRYYSPEQLAVIDCITLCIQLGVPLKKLKSYIDGDGEFMIEKFYRDGKEQLGKKLDELRAKLQVVEHSVSNIEDNLLYKDKRGIYVREIAKRFIKARAFEGEWRDVKNTEKFVMELFTEAQSEGLVPIAPAGLIIDLSAEGAASFFVEVLRHERAETIAVLPAGKYSCLQVDLTPKTDTIKLIDDTFGNVKKKVVFSNMNLNKYSFSSRHTEIQIFHD